MSECVISLCDRTGRFLQPWAEAGFECYAVDVQHSIRKDRFENGIWFVWGDARTWRPPSGKRPIFVAAFPPCTHVAVSGARDFKKKGGQMLRDSLETFEACRQAAAWSGAPYLIENPVGILSSIPHIGKPNYWFDPCDYTLYEPADNYTKKTGLWTGNGFVMPPPAKLVGLPPPDDRIHKASPGSDRGDVRSETPLGFSRAVFLENNPRLFA
jgi:hypothetical protein